MSEFVPIIRLEVEHLKDCVIKAMGIHGSELEKIISERVDEALKTLDYSGMIKEVVTQQIRKELENYFEWGEGSKAIQAAIKELFNPPTLGGGK